MARVSEFPIECARLRESRIWAMCRDNPELTRPVVNLWLRSWESSPPGTLPNDDQILARAADLPLPDFKRLRSQLLHGFAENADRLVHPVICEKAAKKPSRVARKVEEYSADFERLWKEYEVGKLCPNASKNDAWIAFNQMAAQLPSMEILLGCVGAYKSSLKRTRGGDSQAKHPASWIRSKGWETFADSAVTPSQAISESEAKSRWAGNASPLVEKIGAVMFVAWFDNSTFRRANGDGITRIKVKSAFAANWIKNRFFSELEAAYGNVEIMH